MSLRAKLLILSIILALIPLGISGNSMIRIVRDELKSSANDNLIVAARQVSQEIEDFYRYSWLAPLKLIKKAVESENLGVNEKFSLLTEGMKSITDIVALQISVQGITEPLLVTQDEFLNKLLLSPDDPTGILRLSSEYMEDFLAKKEKGVFVGEITYLSQADSWLLTIILPLEISTFGRPAALSARINLERLRTRIQKRQKGEVDTIILVDPLGRKIFDRENPDVKAHKLVQTAMHLLKHKRRTVGVEPFTRPSGEKMLGAYAFPAAPELGVIVEKNEYDAYKAVSKMVNNLIFSIIVGISIAVIGAIVLSVSLTSPLRKLTVAANKISKGELTVRIAGKKRKDEIGQLSKAFNKMVLELDLYIKKLTETTKARERVESELKLAMKIQQSFLPKEFPQLTEIDVWGICDPARGVGGDYFDFFPIDDENYGMVIGDVSGKGVPAALFMAVSRTLFRILCARGEYSPEHVLTEFNNRLVELNQGSGMFITIFYAVYNINTGRLLYSTAGHNMPYIRTNNGEKKGFFMLPSMKTMVAGIMDDMEMELAETTLRSGDVIVLYTDGMIEAENNKDEEFGEEGLEELLNSYHNMTAQKICHKVVEDVKTFQTGKEQFDDMTMFVLRVKSLSADN